MYIILRKPQKERDRNMDTGSMKNIVVLKDLPSNLVEEAIIFLKENQKLKKPELIDSELKQNQKKTVEKDFVEKKEETKNSKDYIVNEAKMLIADYISRLENKNRKEDVSYKKLKKKYKLLKKVSASLAIALAVSICLIFKI